MISIRCTQYILSPYLNPYKYKPEIQIKIFRRRRGKFLNRKCIFPTITRSKNCSKYLTKEKGEEDKLNARRKAPHPLPLGWWGGWGGWGGPKNFLRKMVRNGNSPFETLPYRKFLKRRENWSSHFFDTWSSPLPPTL